MNLLLNKSINFYYVHWASSILNFYTYEEPITALFFNLHNLSTNLINLSSYFIGQHQWSISCILPIPLV